MKKACYFLLSILLFFIFTTQTYAKSPSYNEADFKNADLGISANSAILVDAKTGTVLYEKNSDESLPPASVTKVMTLLLITEAIDSGKIALEDLVTISPYAASMGGSQVFLEEGESFTVEELIKCTVIASANDASVALAEHCYGSESAFVNAMNLRAREMGLKGCAFENTTGLDDTTNFHYMSARDIAAISRVLIKNDIILKYSSLWQDSIRDGEFTLTNTNRLVRYYDGCNGLKTGSTEKAGYCISATAERDGMQLIAVIMGAETRDVRNNEARQLLDYGFANYSLFSKDEILIEYAKLIGARDYSIALYQKPISLIIPKEQSNNIEIKYDIPEKLLAPLDENEIVGTVKYYIENNLIGETEIFVKDSADKLRMTDIFELIIKNIF